MKKITIIILLAFFAGQFTSTPIWAQKEEKKDRIERLKSQKVAFLTERVALSTSEAQKFWPVYNEFSAKMDSLWYLKKSNIRELHQSLESLTEREKEAAIDRHVSYEVQKAQLEKKYHTKFKEILSIDKVIKLYDAEHEFKKKMLKLIRGDKQSSCTETKDPLKEIV